MIFTEFRGTKKKEPEIKTVSRSLDSDAKTSVGDIRNETSRRGGTYGITLFVNKG